MVADGAEPALGLLTEQGLGTVDDGERLVGVPGHVHQRRVDEQDEVLGQRGRLSQPERLVDLLHPRGALAEIEERLPEPHPGGRLAADRPTSRLSAAASARCARAAWASPVISAISPSRVAPKASPRRAPATCACRRRWCANSARRVSGSPACSTYSVTQR